MSIIINEVNSYNIIRIQAHQLYHYLNIIKNLLNWEFYPKRVIHKKVYKSTIMRVDQQINTAKILTLG